jgi:hypothetical protein
MKLLSSLGSILLGLSFLAPLSVGAMPEICGIAPSDCMIVFNPPGVGGVFSSVAVTEAEEDPTALYVVPGVAGNPAGGTTTLIELGGNAIDGPFSDIFGVADLDTALVLAFQSDGEGTELSPPPGTIFLFETTEGPYDATIYLHPDLQSQGYTAQFFSDVEVSVPEPSSLILLGSGLLGFALIRRRKVV